MLLRLVTAGLIAYSYYEIKLSLPRFAMHGSAPSAISATLWVSLFAQILVSGLLLAIPLIARAMPEAVHFGWRCLSDYTPKQRERIMPLLTRMFGVLSVTFNLFSDFDTHMRIQAALADIRQRPPILSWVVGLLISLAAITYYYIRRFDEEAGRE